MPPRRQSLAPSRKGESSLEKMPDTTKDARDKAPSVGIDGQTLIDKHLKPKETASHVNVKETLQVVCQKLNQLASQEYIEERFKQMISLDVLSQKLKELESELKFQMKELEKVYSEVNSLRSSVVTLESSVDTLRNNISDMEQSLEKVNYNNDKLLEENKCLSKILAWMMRIPRKLRMTRQKKLFNL